jgi:hypothetical protein
MKIQKSMSPEEKSVIANVRSLLDQLEQLEQGEGEEPDMIPDESNGEMPVEKTEKTERTDGMPAGDKEVEGLEEDKIEKSETADASAEEKIKELPEDDEVALKVLKALIGIGERNTGTVRKSARVDTANDVQVRTLKILKSIQSRLDAQGDAIVGILEGVGVADQVVQQRKPVVAVQKSRDDLISALTDALKTQGTRVEKSASSEPEGNIRDVLTGLFQ